MKTKDMKLEDKIKTLLKFDVECNSGVYTYKGVELTMDEIKNTSLVVLYVKLQLIDGEFTKEQYEIVASVCNEYGI